MKVSKIIIAIWILCTVTQVIHANDLLQDAWQDLLTFAIGERTKPPPQISRDAIVEQRIAQYVDGEPIKVSATFLSKLESERELTLGQKQGILLFVLGHEVGHGAMIKGTQNEEMQADFFGALLVTSIRGDYDKSASLFFDFARPFLGESKVHGSAGDRVSNIEKNKETVLAISKELREIMRLLDSEEDGAAKTAAARLEKTNKRIGEAGLTGISAFAAELVMVQHRRWLQSANRKDIMVQLSLTLPSENLKSRNAKNAKEIPGDSTLFWSTKELYEKYINNFKVGVSHRINYYALLVYDQGASSAINEALPELEKNTDLSAHDLNNLGVVHFVLADMNRGKFTKAIDLFERARNKNASGVNGDRYLEAKILYNIAKTQERLSKAEVARETMVSYLNHPGAHPCWRTAKLECPSEFDKYTSITELGGFSLGDTVVQVNARKAKFFNACKATELKPRASGKNEIMELSCNNEQSHWTFIFAEKRLSYIQVSGKSDPYGTLKFNEAEGAEQITFKLGEQALLTKLTAKPDINSEARKRYPKLGLTLTIDSAQTLRIRTLAIGKDS